MARRDHFPHRSMDEHMAALDAALARIASEAAEGALRDAAAWVAEIDGRDDDAAADWLRARADRRAAEREGAGNE
ncbi:hypothetical protein [Demequina sp. SO4-18]|uniref:hypothetical protein n=1 Tax=Demequina sp. SO4-18 TaxID=3401026 RepID=UPI003B5B5072